MIKEFFGSSKRALIALAVVLGVIAWGCNNNAQASNPSDWNNNTAQAAHDRELQLTQNYQAMYNKPGQHPNPNVNGVSNELANIARRQNDFNQNPNKIGYLYLLSMDGSVVAYFTIKGKVTALDSQNTPTMGCREFWTSGYDCALTELPQQDGSYGTNGKGIYFFTTNGTYGEWPGWYFFSDRQLNLTTPPKLVVTVPGG